MAVDRDPFVVVEFRCDTVDIPGKIWIYIHTSVKIKDNSPINRFGKTIHRLLIDEITEWPDDDFAPIKAELLKTLEKEGHFERGM